MVGSVVILSITVKKTTLHSRIPGEIKMDAKKISTQQKSKYYMHIVCTFLLLIIIIIKKRKHGTKGGIHVRSILLVGTYG